MHFVALFGLMCCVLHACCMRCHQVARPTPPCAARSTLCQGAANHCGLPEGYVQVACGFQGAGGCPVDLAFAARPGGDVRQVFEATIVACGPCF
jgi:hypothetical protein